MLLHRSRRTSRDRYAAFELSRAFNVRAHNQALGHASLIGHVTERGPDRDEMIKAPRDAMGLMVNPIDALFRPSSIAVVGATDKPPKRGAGVLVNLMTNSGGATVYPVNPQHVTLFGTACYPSILDVPGPVDLALIATHANAVPEIISQCIKANVRAAIGLASAFRERGPAGGGSLEDEILARARAGGLRILGPNSLGLMLPGAGLNATFAKTSAAPGTVGFASQSASLCASILDWSLTQQFGFSAFISMGSMLDVGWGDVIGYLGDDPRTKSIVLFMESVGDARSFLSAAREVALTKPIIVIKAGRTEAAAKAAASDTGKLTGSDDVLDAAFRRCGVLRVETIDELFAMADVLAKQPRPKGNRLAIVTNAGGPAVFAADALVEGGGQTASLDESTLDQLDVQLAPFWSRANPVDIHGDATPEDYAKAVEIVAADSCNDGILVMFSPQAGPGGTEVAQRVTSFAKLRHKPILASWMGGAGVADGADMLERVGIPTFAFPDDAARIFNLMWRYDANLRALCETPAALPAELAPDRAAVRAVFAQARADGRTVLTAAESTRLLEAYEIPSVPTRVATTPQEAIDAAESFGFPVAVKLRSDTLLLKADVGGNRLSVRDADGVVQAFAEIAAATRAEADRDAFQGVVVQPMIATEDGYNLILGSSVDPQFGPVLLFGNGGRLVDVLRDQALGLPPLNETLARRMIEGTRISKALANTRGRRGVDKGPLAQLLVRFSAMIVDQPRIKELDINPFFATRNRFVALDTRVVLHPFEIADGALPRSAIRPYPSQYVGTCTLPDGTVLTLRPIRPEDEPLMRPFHAKLSDQSVYTRYMYAFRLADRIAHERLSRMCFIDYLREMALVALHANAAGEQEIVGVGRLLMEHSRNEAEFALLISDEFQRRGLGSELLRRLVETGRREHVARIVGYIFMNNTPMLNACRRLGFRHEHEFGDPMLRSIIDLRS
jgi:acetyltransferase